MTTSAIRRYRASDLEAVMEIWAAASAVAHPFLGDELLEAERRAVARDHLPRAETWVWDAAGRVGGFIALLGHEIGGLFVDPARHRGGIGGALVEHARRLHGDLEVEVFERNAIGRAFYAKRGFALVEEKVDEATGLGVLRLRLPSKF